MVMNLGLYLLIALVVAAAIIAELWFAPKKGGRSGKRCHEGENGGCYCQCQGDKKTSGGYEEAEESLQDIEADIFHQDRGDID